MTQKRKSANGAQGAAVAVSNSKKDFTALIKAAKQEIHKLGFVTDIVAKHCKESYYENVATNAGIKLAPRTKERLQLFYDNRDAVLKAVVSYYPRIILNGVTTLVVTKTYETTDDFNEENNTKNPKVLDNAVRLVDGMEILQAGFTKQPYKTWFNKDTMILYIKTAKSWKDGNITTSSKVFHKKERFSIDEVVVACIRYAQSDAEIIPRVVEEIDIVEQPQMIESNESNKE